ncbi:MAG: rod shape-determining protein [Clostridia bacterium]|nr:rod shape-determining protein [Clostridia bacterium]
MFKSQDIAIDLGTATILVYTKDKGIVINEPSVVAVETSTGKLMEVGQKAHDMIGRNPDDITVIRPMRKGVISDFDSTMTMIKYILNKACKWSFFKPRVIVCIPSVITEVEKKAVVDAMTGGGARNAYLIEEPIAAAIGAGLDIAKPAGHLVIDIGGGTTDIAVISLGSMVVHTSLKIAGDEFDQDIIKYVKKTHNMIIGERMAELVKKEIGCVYPQGEQSFMKIKGRSMVSGLPMEVMLSSDEMLDALKETADMIVAGVKDVLERTPPELIGDISVSGAVLTGGGSLIKGLDKLIALETSLEVKVADDPVSCVVLGTGKALDEMKTLRKTKRRY